MNKLFYGIGVNSKRKHKTKINKQHTAAYRTWRNMLTRCYDAGYQKNKPSYIGCSVSDDWHDFQDFADWFYCQQYSESGYHLDKDVLSENNKLYSPENCCFIPFELNMLLTDRALHRGGQPQGVFIRKATLKYGASISLNGKQKTLGYFASSKEAYEFYKATKERYVKNKALEWANRIEWRVFVALMSWELPEYI